MWEMKVKKMENDKISDNFQIKFERIPTILHLILVPFNLFCYIVIWFDPTFLIVAILEMVALLKWNRESLTWTIIFSISANLILIIRTIITFNITRYWIGYKTFFKLDNYYWSVLTVIFESFVIVISIYNHKKPFNISILKMILGQLLFFGVFLLNLLSLLDAPFEDVPDMRKFHIIILILSIVGILLLIPIQKWRKIREYSTILLSMFNLGMYIFFFVYDWDIIFYEGIPNYNPLNLRISDVYDFFHVLFGILFNVIVIVLLNFPIFKNWINLIKDRIKK